MKPLHELAAIELGGAVRRREVSPTEVLDHFERRIAEGNPRLNAFVQLRFEEARRAAVALEARLARGEDPGPLAGVPVGLKDFLPSKRGWTHTHGGVRPLERGDGADSEFCRATEAAGAIAVGKTNAPAFGFRGTTDNLMFGPTRNPWDLSRNSGGSSGGSAAAVAAGLVPLAEGTDGGGSIRIPAAWCGCVGFKPTAGLVPSLCRPDAWAGTHPYCADGALARTVADSALAASLMARHEPRDPLSVPVPPAVRGFPALMRRSIRGWRIAWTPDFGVFPVDAAVRGAAERALRALEDAGAVVEPVPFRLRTPLRELAECWCRAISVDSAIDLELWRREGLDLLRDHRGELPGEFVFWTEAAARSTVLDYRRFNEIRTEILDAFEDVFSTHDLLASPVTACPPVENAPGGNTLGPAEIDGTPVERLIGFCMTFLSNFSGHPAISVPAGFLPGTPALPAALQLTAPKFRDGDLFAAARALEERAGMLPGGAVAASGGGRAQADGM